MLYNKKGESRLEQRDLDFPVRCLEFRRTWLDYGLESVVLYFGIYLRPGPAQFGSL